MGILICQKILFVKRKTHRFVFYLSGQTIIAASELFFFSEPTKKIMQ